jgi:peptide chain release factor subunit 1
MAVQTDEVRDLAGFQAPEGFLVTTFYLDVNAQEFPAPEHVMKAFDSLIHTAEDRRKEIEEGLSHEAQESVRGDLARLRDWIKGWDRQDANGVAVFSCSALDLWEVYPTPTGFTSQVFFDPNPQLAPLAAFLSHTKPTAVLITDKQHARIFTMKHGEVREWTDFEDFVPQRTEQGGWSQNRYQRRSDHWKQHHIDKADELVLRLEQHYPFDWLVIGAEEQDRNQITERLHPYVKDRVIGYINVRIDAPEAEIVEEARHVREEAESHLIRDLIERIQEYAGAGGRGTIGLKDTLQAINEQKVHILLVQDGFQEPGTRCPDCGMLHAGDVDTCPACGGRTEQVDNIVDAAVQKSLELGSSVEVATELEVLEPIQCMGAVMYY